MIVIDLETVEFFNPRTQEFTYEQGGVVRFEYSLRAVYEWEARWGKPFLSQSTELTEEETIDFYMRMALDPMRPEFLTRSVRQRLSNYISQSSTATTFTSPGGGGQNGNRNNGKTYTSEEIYALMFQAGVPIEFEHRNLNRLMVILRIISNNSSEKKKMSNQDILRQNSNLNAQRKARLKTKG